MSLPVRIERAAELHAAELKAWWKHNRRAARPLKKLLRDAFKRIGDAPYVPAVFERIDDIDVRRVAIKTTPYYAYYCVDEEASAAVVIAIWSAQRGEGPVLRPRRAGEPK